MFAAFLSGLALMLFLSNGGVWRSLLRAAIGAAVAALVELVSKEGTPLSVTVALWLFA